MNCGLQHKKGCREHSRNLYLGVLLMY